MDIWEGLWLQPTTNNKQRLVKEYVYKDVVVSKGFETNGEDSPRITWVFGFPPFKPLYAPAYVVHDWMINEAIDKRSVELVLRANEYWAELMLLAEDSFKVRYAIEMMNRYWEIRTREW